MTTPTEFRGALASISTAISSAVTASGSSEHPYTSLVATLDQIRAFVDQMGEKVTEEPAAGVAGLLCFGCILQHHAAHQQGLPIETLAPIAVAEFVVEGRSLARCHLTLQNGPVIPGRSPGGIILGGG